MQVGMLTAPFSGEDIETVVGFAAQVGFECLEILATPDCAHFDADRAKDLPVIVRNAGMEISSLAAYIDITAADADERKRNQQWVASLVEICSEIDVEVLCCNAGLPPPGMSREEALE